MARPSTVPDELLNKLRDYGAKGATKEELCINDYHYKTLLNLSHMNLVSKIGEKWYVGNPEQWLAEVDVDAWIHFNDEVTNLMRNPKFHLVPGTREIIDGEELKERALIGLWYYILWCKYNNPQLPFPTTQVTAENTEQVSSRIKWLIQTVSRTS